MVLNNIYIFLSCNSTEKEPILKFINEFTISDIISFLSMVLIVIGGCFSYHQWKKSVKIKRAEYINELTEKIRTDVDIKEIVYVLDYDHKWYTPNFHDCGELERKMDKTLSYFSYICYLYRSHLIAKKEFGFFKYEIDRILMNNQIQNYFYNLYHFSNKFKAPITFKYLFEYGEKNKIFDEEFYNSKSEKYVHYLNF